MPSFRAGAPRGLGPLGLAGRWADIRLGADALILAGTDGRRVDVPFDAVDRVRFGYQTSRTGGRFYEMRLWTHRARRGLLLRLIDRETTPGYEAVARGLAAAVAARRGIGAVEGGLGWAWALFYGGFAVGFLGYGGWVELQFIRAGIAPAFVLAYAAMVLAVGGTVGYGFVRLFCPRRLSRLDQLEPLIATEKRLWLF